MYPNALLSVYSLLVSRRADSIFSKSVPPSIPFKPSRDELVCCRSRNGVVRIVLYRSLVLLSGAAVAAPLQEVFCVCFVPSPKSVNATILRACS